MTKLTRRDFLKLASLLPAEIAFRKISFETNEPNIIILILDALSAKNMSLYGYERETTPNISHFAERAHVYHSHYSAGTFTTPGTSSLLTGMYPWKHRAVNLTGLILREFVNNNIFNLLKNDRYTVGFTQNYLTEFILSQLNEWMNLHIPLGTYSELEQFYANPIQKDMLIRQRAFDRFLLDNTNPPASLLFGGINHYQEGRNADRIHNEMDKVGIEFMERDTFFLIEKVFDKLAKRIHDFSSPFFGYFHLLPPHETYVPGPDFMNKFSDNWHPPKKPRHPVLKNWENNSIISSLRRTYDQYLARTDAAFGQFIQKLDNMGVLDNSYFILTSDHGEMFERGVTGHLSPLVYEAGIGVPLLLHAPGQSSRSDYYAPTNSIDIVPTIMALLGKSIPNWCEGKILPGFGGKEDYERFTYSMVKKSGSSVRDKLSPITIAMRQGSYKLIYYVGYKDYKKFATDKRYLIGTMELYDIEDDPDELHDMTEKQPEVAKRMLAELLRRYEQEGAALD
jgi:arylsulfatase A-like enzyme